jgi:hypothetical protein
MGQNAMYASRVVAQTVAMIVIIQRHNALNQKIVADVLQTVVVRLNIHTLDNGVRLHKLIEIALHK